MSLVQALKMLEQAGSDMNTEENRINLRQNEECATDLAKGLIKLTEANLLTPENRAKLLQYIHDSSRYYLEFAETFEQLDLNGLMTQENFDAIMANGAEYSRDLNIGITSLSEVDILDQENFMALTRHFEYTMHLATALKKLARAGILTQENRLSLEQNAAGAGNMADGLKRLTESNLLTLVNRRLLEQYPALGFGLSWLSFVQLSSPENCNVLMQNAQYNIQLVNTFSRLGQKRLLTQTNFDTLMQNAQRSEFIDSEIYRALNRDRLTQEEFSNIIRRAQPAPVQQHRFFVTQPSTIPNLARLEEAKFPNELVPERYTCALLFTIMDNPVQLPTTKQVCERSAVVTALAGDGRNPFNRQPMEINQAVGDRELKEEINAYVDAIVDAVSKKKQELSQEVPPREDITSEEYQILHNSVINPSFRSNFLN